MEKYELMGNMDISLSGRDVRCPSAEEMVYTIKERQYCEQIENAYSYASKLLLNLLMEDYQLMDRLRWVDIVKFMTDQMFS